MVFDRPVSGARAALDPNNYFVTGTTVTNVTFMSPITCCWVLRPLRRTLRCHRQGQASAGGGILCPLR